MTLERKVYCDWIQDGLEGQYHTMHLGLGEALAEELNVSVQEWDLKEEVILLESASNNHLIVNRKSAMRQVFSIFSIYYGESRAIETNKPYVQSLRLSAGNLRTDPYVGLKFQKLPGGKFAAWEVIETGHKIGHEKC